MGTKRGGERRGVRRVALRCVWCLDLVSFLSVFLLGPPLPFLFPFFCTVSFLLLPLTSVCLSACL